MHFHRKFQFLATGMVGMGPLGWHRRVVLPSRALAQIRSEFPSDYYTGHQHSPPPTTP